MGRLGGPLFPQSEIDVVAPSPSCCLGAREGWLSVLDCTQTKAAQRRQAGRESSFDRAEKYAGLGRDSAGWCPCEAVVLSHPDPQGNAS